MDLLSLGKITSDESQSLKFLQSRYKKQEMCPFCSSDRLYTMKSRMRYRCRSCKHDFKPFADARLNSVKIPYSKWLALIKLFELSVSAKAASEQTKTSYKTALKAFDAIRNSILERHAEPGRATIRGEIEADEAYFGGKRKGHRGRGARNKVIVFGILERGGKVSVSIVQNVSAKTLMGETVKKVRRGSIVYTDKWAGYDSLMFCGYKHLSVDHRYKFKSGKVYINEIEGFWSFAKERLIKHHGISPKKFLLYIKEMEWRYNNRKNNNLFDLLVDYVLGVKYP